MLNYAPHHESIWRVEVYLHAFVTLVLYEGGWVPEPTLFQVLLQTESCFLDHPTHSLVTILILGS